MPPRGGEYARCAGDSYLTLPRLPVLSRLTQGAVRHQHSNESDAANFAVVDRTAGRNDLSEDHAPRYARAWHCYRQDRSSIGFAPRFSRLVLVA
jgi:hypothetical protein